MKAVAETQQLAAIAVVEQYQMLEVPVAGLLLLAVIALAGLQQLRNIYSRAAAAAMDTTAGWQA